MIHSILQVLGLVILACGAWLAFGVGGVLIVSGLALTVGSLIVEFSSTKIPDGGE